MLEFGHCPDRPCVFSRRRPPVRELLLPMTIPPADADDFAVVSGRSPTDTNGIPDASVHVPGQGERIVETADEGFRRVLRGYSGNLLRVILERLDVSAIRSNQPAALCRDLEEQLRDPSGFARAVAPLSRQARCALGLLAVREARVVRFDALAVTLKSSGIVRPTETILELVQRGLLALAVARREAGSGTEPRGSVLLEDLDAVVARTPAAWIELRPAPRVFTEGRLDPHDPLPAPAPASASRRAEAIRLADGLELPLRVAALWQRVATQPLRIAQNGAFYKRDRDRLEDDPALAGPPADALEPIPDQVLFWIQLALEVGLLVEEPEVGRVVAAPAEFWDENAFHLPQMLAAAWLRLERHHERLGAQEPGRAARLLLPHLRLPVLARLATLPNADDPANPDPEHWTAVEDLANALERVCPEAARLAFAEPPPTMPSPPSRPNAGTRTNPPAEFAVTSGPTVGSGFETIRADLTAMLLGPAYQLRLVAVAREAQTGRTLVRLTALGRYLLRLGPPPPPPPPYDHFLNIQPNFEMIAYRQGLNPGAIGKLTLFGRWTKLGGAAELKVTEDSLTLGLHGGLSVDAILERLRRHSPRPLAPALERTLRGWSARRERITLHTAATLLEFATPEDLEEALKRWPVEETAPSTPLDARGNSQAEGREEPVDDNAPNESDPAHSDHPGRPRRLTSRILLVPDPRRVPLALFRLNGSRDYRLPRGVCARVDEGGIEITLDPRTSDLLAEIELSGFARFEGVTSEGERTYRVTPASLAQGQRRGWELAKLDRWFRERCGHPIPPALRLLWVGVTPRVADSEAEAGSIQDDPHQQRSPNETGETKGFSKSAPARPRPAFNAASRIVLTAPDPIWLDGLIQHPDTRAALDQRLGPTAALVHPERLADLKRTLERLGWNLDMATNLTDTATLQPSTNFAASAPPKGPPTAVALQQPADSSVVGPQPPRSRTGSKAKPKTATRSDGGNSTQADVEMSSSPPDP